MAQRDLLKEGILGNKKILIGSAIIGTVLIIALFAPLIAPHDPEAIDLRNRIAPWTLEHPLGTDYMGRCLLSMLVRFEALSSSLLWSS